MNNMCVAHGGLRGKAEQRPSGYAAVDWKIDGRSVGVYPVCWVCLR